MYRVRLTEEEREELKRRTRAANIKPRTRDRLEMVRLSDAGWRVPQIAAHLRVSAQRVRVWIRNFLDEGFDALEDQPHLGRTPRMTPAVLEALRQELDKGDRTWTARQVADWLQAEHGIKLSRRQASDVMRRAKLSCRRTEPNLGHKQDPEQVAIATADLETLEKGENPGAWTSATSTRRGSL